MCLQQIATNPETFTYIQFYTFIYRFLNFTVIFIHFYTFLYIYIQIFNFNVNKNFKYNICTKFEYFQVYFCDLFYNTKLQNYYFIKLRHILNMLDSIILLRNIVY